jgi:predicted  nucleic acid-binding Zn-ribbon protein
MHAGETAISTPRNEPRAIHRSDSSLEAISGGGHDINRLDTAVQTLIERFVATRTEIASLRTEVAVRERRIDELELEIQQLRQSRRDVAKRIDEMIGQISQLETRLVARAEA